MPRRKALPEELDPLIREFAGQLRTLVDRSGLGIAAVADRTGCSETSWGRYLDGRLLPPEWAIVALAEVTGADRNQLTVRRELAERVWSRSRMPRDMSSQVPARPDAPAVSGSAPGVAGTRPSPGRRTGSGRPGRRREVTMFLTGVVGALVVTAGAVLLTDLGGAGGSEGGAAIPSVRPSTTAPPPPAGVACGGADCTGRDPEDMGCGGRFAATVARATVGGTLVEVRYSRTCAAAWARITRATPGDTVRISAGPAGQDGTVDADTDAYTPMVAVRRASDARACATLAAGTTGCTTAE